MSEHQDDNEKDYGGAYAVAILFLCILVMLLFGCTLARADPAYVPQVQSQPALQALPPGFYTYVHRTDLGMDFAWSTTPCGTPTTFSVPPGSGTGCWNGLPPAQSANASTLSGNTLASNVLNSSLQTLGTISTGVWQGTPISNAYLANVSVTVNGTACTLGSTCSPGAAAAALTGTTLASGVTASSLTSVALGTLGGMAVQSPSAVAITGATQMTGLPTPTNASDAATKSYVDTAVAAGVTYHLPVAATTFGVLSNSPTYNNGSSGVGATLTAGSNGALTVDGYTVLLNDRVLVMNQAAPLQNGCYVQSTLGTVSVPYVLTRCVDFNQVSNITTNSFFLTKNGTINTGASFALTTTGTIVVGTTALNFNQSAASQTYTAGSGLTLSGSQFSLTNSATTVNTQSCALGASCTVTAAAGTLTGSTLASGVTASSLTSLGTLTSLTTSGQITSTYNSGPPFVVTNPTTVLNLSANYLNGFTWNMPGTIGATTPNTGAFTSLSVSSAASGAGFNGLFASPPVTIGGVTPVAGAFTTLTTTGQLTANGVLEGGSGSGVAIVASNGGAGSGNGGIFRLVSGGSTEEGDFGVHAVLSGGTSRNVEIYSPTGFEINANNTKGCSGGLQTDNVGTVSCLTGTTGVVGPASSVTNHVAGFYDTTGKTLIDTGSLGIPVTTTYPQQGGNGASSMSSPQLAFYGGLQAFYSPYFGDTTGDCTTGDMTITVSGSPVGGEHPGFTYTFGATTATVTVLTVNADTNTSIATRLQNAMRANANVQTIMNIACPDGGQFDGTGPTGSIAAIGPVVYVDQPSTVSPTSVFSPINSAHTTITIGYNGAAPTSLVQNPASSWYRHVAGRAGAAGDYSHFELVIADDAANNPQILSQRSYLIANATAGALVGEQLWTWGSGMCGSFQTASASSFFFGTYAAGNCNMVIYGLNVLLENASGGSLPTAVGTAYVCYNTSSFVVTQDSSCGTSVRAKKLPHGELADDTVDRMFDIVVPQVFAYKADPSRLKLGFYADDVCEADPRACLYDVKGAPEGYDDRALIAALWGKVREQDARIHQLERR